MKKKRARVDQNGYEAALLRRRINAGVHGKTMGKVIDLFKRELSGRVNTLRTVKAALAHCRRGWEDEPIAELADPIHSKRIEEWLNSLTSIKKVAGGAGGRPLASSTKHHVKVYMGIVFECAMRHGYIPSAIDPMKFVHLKAEPEDPPRRQTLTVEQW